MLFSLILLSSLSLHLFMDVKCSAYLPPHLKKNTDRIKAWAKCSRYVLFKLYPIRGFGRLFSSARYNKYHVLHWGHRDPRLKGLLKAFKEDPSLGFNAFGILLSGKWYPSPDKKSSPNKVSIKKYPKKGHVYFPDVAPEEVIRPIDAYLDDPGHWIFVMKKADGNLSYLFRDTNTLNQFVQAVAVRDKPIPEILIREVYKKPIQTIGALNKGWDESTFAERSISPEKNGSPAQRPQINLALFYLPGFALHYRKTKSLLATRQPAST
ncbi:hypothetical protein BJ684DRAFT_16807 [Piptocephalis cylindrospora]|uniref:Uncharacterized protein n=1 Tax=Piptocephalis cylindrospora TaxID=1907219 RepID=A0A4V1IXZ1_9FUNG|nr:hypothetical protein BJ684DRAFT_16807 [Piptocephalis cylindrospora]|eukprot:RKP12739.1 hypothetical protein BJ684DRAFT_16807 [Piptocephalis cylindrospora]